MGFELREAFLRVCGVRRGWGFVEGLLHVFDACLACFHVYNVRAASEDVFGAFARVLEAFSACT